MIKPYWLKNVPARVEFEITFQALYTSCHTYQFESRLKELLTLFVENGWDVQEQHCYFGSVLRYSLRKPYPPDLDTPARRIINLNPSPVAVTEPSHRTGRS